MARVRSVTLDSNCAGSRLYVTGSISTKIGVAPTRAIAPAVAKKVYGVVMTSSPCPIPSAMRQMSKASVPEETPTACEQLLYRAMAFSHSCTLGPRMKCCDSITSATARSTSALIAKYCALRSNKGTFMSWSSFLSIVYTICCLSSVRVAKVILHPGPGTEGLREGLLCSGNRFQDSASHLRHQVS